MAQKPADVKAGLTESQSEFAAEMEEAKKSGRPFRVVHEVGGPSSVVFLTAPEIADAQARSAVEAEEKSARANRTTEEKLAELGFTVEELRAVLKG